MKKLKLTALAFFAGTVAQAASISGWVAAESRPPYTSPTYYTTPDPDYDHFIATVILPLVNYDEAWARLGRFDMEIYWMTFDCGCASYVPGQEIPAANDPPVMAAVPEPTTFVLAAFGLGMAVAFWIAGRRLRVDAKKREDEDEYEF